MSISIWENLILKSIEDLLFLHLNIITQNIYATKIMSRIDHARSFQENLLIEKALCDLLSYLHGNQIVVTQKSQFFSFDLTIHITNNLILYSNVRLVTDSQI